MNDFPRTTIETLSVSRLMIGTNWFLGFSHRSKAQDRDIQETMDAARIAEVLKVFLRAGVDTFYGMRPEPKLVEAVDRAEQSVGRRIIRLAIPSWPVTGHAADQDEARRVLDAHRDVGVDICMPHQCVTDAFVDRKTRRLPGIEPFLAMIRERSMIPGLSSHMPETPLYADAAGLDVQTYCQIYNALGFLMQIEVEWVHQMIARAKKPVIAIKPLAAGRLTPLVGLAFAWSTFRAHDMVAVGVSSPYQAEEIIETSLALLERRPVDVALTTSRSKSSLSP